MTADHVFDLPPAIYGADYVGMTRLHYETLRRSLTAALEREKVLADRCKWYADSQEKLRARVCRQNEVDERGGM